MLVVIKGTRREAYAALVARGLWLNAVYRGCTRNNEQQIFLPDSKLANVIAWHAVDSGGPPYPPGTLLFYRLYKTKWLR